MKRTHLYLGMPFVIFVVSAYIFDQFVSHDPFLGVLCAIPCLLISLMIAAAVESYLKKHYPGLLYSPDGDTVDMGAERPKRRGDENANVLNVLENELLYPYTSLSWKYKLISDFCYNYPELINRLKESERYITWRSDVIDWAQSNINRFDGFYFNDGIVNYVFDPNYQTNGMVELNKKYGYSPDPDYEVICEIDFKKSQLSEDYFEFPNLVWESEDVDVDDYETNSKHSSASDAFFIGTGIGIANGLTDGSVFGSVSSSNSASSN